MAAIGDVLVKFVADFAEFSANMGKSQKDIESWAQSISKAGQSVQGFIALATRVGGALAIGEAIKQAIAFNDQMQKSGEALAAYSLRTDAAARSTRGLTEESVRLAELYKAAGVEWTQDYLARVQKAQDASEDFSAKSFVLGQRLHNLYLELTQRPGDSSVMDWASKEANGLFDWLEKLVPAINNAVDALAKGFVIQLVATANGLRLVIAATVDLYNWLAKVATQATVSGSALEQMARDAAKARGYNTGQNQPTPPTGAGGAFGMFDAQGNATTAAEAARQQQATQQALGRRYGTQQGLGVPLGFDAGGANAPPKGGGGGGGAADSDSIEAQIRRYNALADAATKAQKTISENNNQAIEDLKRQVTVQQQVDDITGKLEAKHIQISDDQKKRLTEAVTAAETQRAAEQKLLDVNIAAVETDKKYGDGTVALTKLHKDLALQLDTHRINQTEANRATKEGTEAIQQAALAAQRYDDDLGSLAAGFAHAANAYSRANDLYSAGEQIFSGLTSSMMEGLKALEGQSQKSFQQIAADFANMLAQIALQAAASAAFKAIFGAIGGGAGGADAIMGLVPVAGTRAAGGPVSAGQSYLVGEQGPEMFVPSAAGNIVPSSQASATSGGVTVNVDMGGSGGSGTDPNQAMEFGRRVKQAVVSVINNEKRPGGTLYSRLSA
jgi:hypothetical protein